MPSPILDAVGITATNMQAALTFYRALGFEFPELQDGDVHIEAVSAPGKVRLMIDEAAFAASLVGEAVRPSNGSAFALLFDAPDDVDAACAKVRNAGAAVLVEPWDAFWGQRYCTIMDPDCYRIDLFAPL